MKSPLHAVFIYIALMLAPAARAIVPEHTVENGIIKITGAGPDNPIIYDNDWWKDVPDAAYLWAKVSMGKADLRGNVVTRDMWDWEKGYLCKPGEGMKDARTLLELARASGLQNIPEPIAGANDALVRPASGKVEDTKFIRTPGSELIVAEAKKATPAKPLLVFVGGPCSTIAAAYLTDPSIADRLIVFQIDGGNYNGTDGWAWKIAEQRLPFVNWARGYFWGDWSAWKPERFKELPDNPLGEMLRKYSTSDLGRANQWGDGAWLFQLFAPGCITQVETYDKQALTVPRAGNNVQAMEEEFFRTMKAHKPVPAVSPAFYELRIYTVTSNQMDGVLERFRETVEPVRRKHGIKTAGYWSAPGTTNGGTFVYLMTAASKEELQKQEQEFGADPQFKEGYAASNKKHGKTVGKITTLAMPIGATAKFDFTTGKTPRAFDLRIYSVLPGKLDAFRNRWRDFAVPIYHRHGLHSVGWWVAEQKDADGNDQFVCLLAGESIPAILKSISEFHKDADWIRVEKETETNGKLRSGVTACKLTPTDFSALK